MSYLCYFCSQPVPDPYLDPSAERLPVCRLLIRFGVLDYLYSFKILSTSTSGNVTCHLKISFSTSLSIPNRTSYVAVSASFVSYSKSKAAEALTTCVHDIWPVGEDRIVETCCLRDEETKTVGKTNIGGGVGGLLGCRHSWTVGSRKDMEGHGQSELHLLHRFMGLCGVV